MSQLPILSRRSFLKLAVTAAAAAIIVPAWTPPRDPYVKTDWYVNYIGRHCPGGFMGSARVLQVDEWDRIGYPVTLEDACYMYCREKRTLAQRIYDFDLCILRDEYPPDIWWHEENRRRYPNVHTYVRTRRFGESVADAIRSLNFAHTEEWVKTYGGIV